MEEEPPSTSHSWACLHQGEEQLTPEAEGLDKGKYLFGNGPRWYWGKREEVSQGRVECVRCRCVAGQ